MGESDEDISSILKDVIQNGSRETAIYADDLYALSQPLKEAFQTGELDNCFQALTNILDLPDFNERWVAVDKVLNALERSNIPGATEKCVAFWEKIKKEVHPSREARLQDNKKTFLQRFGPYYNDEILEKRNLRNSSRGTISEPFLDDRYTSPNSENYVSNMAAMAVSLLERRGEPVYVQVLRPEVQPFLIEVDGLNQETSYLFQNREAYLQWDMRQLNRERDPHEKFPPFEGRPTIKIKQDVQELLELPEFVSLGSDRPHYKWLLESERNLEGSGSENDPFQWKKGDIAETRMLLLGLFKSARLSQPVFIRIGSVLLQVDAEYRSVRYIAGSTPFPYPNRNAPENVKHLMEQVLKEINFTFNYKKDEYEKYQKEKRIKGQVEKKNLSLPDILRRMLRQNT